MVGLMFGPVAGNKRGFGNNMNSARAKGLKHVLLCRFGASARAQVQGQCGTSSTGPKALTRNRNDKQGNDRGIR